MASRRPSNDELDFDTDLLVDIVPDKPKRLRPFSQVILSGLRPRKEPKAPKEDRPSDSEFGATTNSKSQQDIGRTEQPPRTKNEEARSEKMGSSFSSSRSAAEQSHYERQRQAALQATTKPSIEQQKTSRGLQALTPLESQLFYEQDRLLHGYEKLQHRVKELQRSNEAASVDVRNAQGAAAAAERECRKLRDQDYSLKQTIAGLTRLDEQVSDNDLSDMVGRLAHDLQNWVLSAFRKSKIGTYMTQARSCTSADYISDQSQRPVRSCMRQTSFRYAESS